MAQLRTINGDTLAYEGSNKKELSEKRLMQGGGTKEAFLASMTDVDVYFTLYNVASKVDTVISELNDRETSTIDGGTF